MSMDTNPSFADRRRKAGRALQGKGRAIVRSRGWVIALAMILCLGLYSLMAIVVLPQLSSLAGGLAPLDMRTGYGVAEVRVLLEALGESGRAYYLFPQLLIDSIFPASVSLAFGLTLRTLLPNWRRVTLFPVTAAIFDYAENLTIYLILQSYPYLSERLIRLGSTLTITKMVAYSCCYVLTIAALAWWGWQRARRNQAQATHPS